MKFIKNYGTIIIFGLICIIIPFKTDIFLTQINLENILMQSAIISIMACGALPVFLSGNTDLSIGATLGLVGSITAILSGSDIPTFLVIFLPIIISIIICLINGILIGRLGLNSFIVTLGTMYIIRGIIFVITEEQTISTVNDLVIHLGTGYIGFIPILGVFMLGVLLIMYFIIHQTPFGNHLVTVGGNEQTAKEWGLNIALIRNLAFVIEGFFIGLAGILHVGRMMCAEAQAGLGFEFQVIGAFVIGGGILFSGEGHIIKTLIGVLIVSVINNGLELLNISPFYQYIIRGGMVITAVGLGVFLKSRIKDDGSRKRVIQMQHDNG